MQSAVTFHSEGRLAEAEALYRDLLRQSASAVVAANLGALLRSQKRWTEAEQHYRWALSACPLDPSLLGNACNLLRECGQAQFTLGWLKQGLQQFPEDPSLRLGLARSLRLCEDVEQAIAVLQALRQLQPDNLDVLLELGTCLVKQGEILDALELFERAELLVPSHPLARASRIALLTDLGRLDEASACLETAPGRGEHPRLIGAEASLLFANNKATKALELHQALTRMEPYEPDHWLNVASCYSHLKYMVAPLEALQQGLRLSPERADLQLSVGSLLVEHGRSAEGLKLLLQSVADPKTKDMAHAMFQFAAAGHRLLPAADLRRHSQEWEQRRMITPSPMWRDRVGSAQSDRRLRIGYLSPDFTNHPVGRFIEPVLAGHHRSAFEVVGLSCGRHRDDFTDHLKKNCDRWIELRYGSDELLARLLADQQLDIIVELAGHSADQRLRLLTARPAPIQLSYLGYPASTYLSCVDGWIGDAVLFGPQQHREMGPKEQLYCLPRSYLAFSPPEVDVAVERSAADARFRFGSFNHSRKYSDACLDLFASVIQAAPQSLLVLKSLSFVEQAERERIEARLMKFGLRAEQLQLLPWAEGRENHLRCYGQLDVALDTLPYSGTTTTCEALWMGVPVLTLAGVSAVERQSASVLVAAGLDAAVTTSKAQFVRQALRFVEAGVRSTKRREQLRTHLQNSPLMDGSALVDSLESLYRTLWQARSSLDRA